MNHKPLKDPAKQQQRSLKLYIHIPFCASKCHFCSWVQGIQTSELLLRPEHDARRAYVRAICREIKVRAEGLQQGGYTPNILYWGGGTATSLTEDEIATIHAALDDAFDLSLLEEATVEGSPDSVTPSKLKFIRQLGYNRVSFGVQSFSDERLRKLGRSHGVAQARRAVEWSHELGFDTNVDLMCGFPDETLEEVERTVRECLHLPVAHVSYYPYRPVNNTVMYQQLANGRTEIDVSEQKAAYALGRALLEDSGYPEYAMSYFGKPHLGDLATFRLKQDWVGFGSGARSLLNGVFHMHQRGRLHAYTADPVDWDVSVPAHSGHVAFTLLNQGLSTFQGIERSDWSMRVGQSLDESLRQPGLREYATLLRFGHRLQEDRHRICLPRDRLAETSIEISYAMFKQSAR